MNSITEPVRPPFFYGWIIVATAFTINVVAAPMNAVVVAFFISPISDDLGEFELDEDR